MSILVAVIAAALALWLQLRSGGDRLAELREDHRPDQKLVDPDERFHLELTIQNTGRHYILFARLEEQLARAFTVRDRAVLARENWSGGANVSFSTWLRPRQEVLFRVEVSVCARGFYLLAPMRISIGDFLGLRERVVYRTGHFRAVVAAPREAEDRRLPEVLGGFLGDLSVRRFIHEDPVLTTGFREYTGREPMRQISWTQSAGGRGLMVKVFDHTAEPQVSVLLNTDTRAKGWEELLERCFSMARTVCRILEERGVQYGFATNAELASFAGGASNEIGRGLGASHFAAVLDCLGRATYVKSASGEAFLTRSADPSEVRGCILITPSDDFAASRALDRLREFGSLLILRADEPV